MTFANINSIKNKRLCSGCGSCTVICPKSCIHMKNGIHYNYPSIDVNSCNGCGLCLKICPGNRILNRLSTKKLLPLNAQEALTNFVAFSADGKIRYNAASGGVISSLLVFLLKHNYIDGAICVKQDEKNSLANRSFIALTEFEVLQASGSRYSPASNCAVIKDILNENKRYAFVGKPCEIDAINEMQRYLPELRKKIRLKISIMCACTPSRKGTLKLLKRLHIEPSEVKKISYRGNGWPGSFRVEADDGKQWSMPYLDAWNHWLSKYSCLRCMVCDDPLGIHSDITVGDAWDTKLIENNTGLSAVIVRTPMGMQVMDMAIENNVISVKVIGADDIYRFQKGLIGKTHSASINILAYNCVFLNKWGFRELLLKSGRNIKTFISLIKRIIKFYIYRISNNYY